MPSDAGLSRATLLTIAGPLIPSARQCFTEAVVRKAADGAKAALAAMRTAHNARASAGGELRTAAAAARLEERRIDVRVGGLYRVLLGMEVLGMEGAGRALALLFPRGVSAVIRPKGPSQRTTYADFHEVLMMKRDLPALRRLGPEVEALLADMATFLRPGQDQDARTASRRAPVRVAQAAEEGLRDALLQLDRAVALVTGDGPSAASQRWADCLRPGRGTTAVTARLEDGSRARRPIESPRLRGARPPFTNFHPRSPEETP